MHTKEYAVYINTNPRHTVFYTGITSNLTQRNYQHKNKLIKGFSSKYNVDKLVYFETHNSSNSAILREKYIKRLLRNNKIKLIKSINLDFKDLSEGLKL